VTLNNKFLICSLEIVSEVIVNVTYEELFLE